jgi:hypothetical protein
MLLMFFLLLGRTKKKIKKLVTLIKVVIAVVLILLKIFTLLYVFGKLLEFKMVILVGINTLINVVKLFLEWKKGKDDHQNVVHYEEAHHEHIHDGNHHFGSGDKGWLGGLWSRSDFLGGRSLTHSHDLAYSAQIPARQQQRDTLLATSADSSYSVQSYTTGIQSQDSKPTQQP